jgi:hypothetical protein
MFDLILKNRTNGLEMKIVKGSKEYMINALKGFLNIELIETSSNRTKGKSKKISES